MGMGGSVGDDKTSVVEARCWYVGDGYKPVTVELEQLGTQIKSK